LFVDSKVVFSFYDNGFDLPLDSSFSEKIMVDGVTSDHVSLVKDPGYNNLVNPAATYSDGLIQGSSNLPDSVSEVLKKTGKPYLDYVNDGKYVEEFSVFYDSVIND
jgi:starch synthase